MRGVNFWLEGGLGYAELFKSNRYSINSEGYLVNRFPDSSENDLYGYAMIHHYWPILDNWNIGVNARGDYSAQGTHSALSFGLNLLWKKSN
jgi:hypothetical protein